MTIRPQFQLEESRTFFEYWQSLPREGLLPDRKSFNPAAIYKLMPEVLMVEFPKEGAPVFRYVGSKLTERVGFDPTQQEYLQFLNPESLGDFFAITETMLNTPCAGILTAGVQAATGWHMRCEATDVPMMHTTNHSLILVSHMPILEVTGSHDSDTFAITELGVAQWIDIGAGIPG
ncbi:MAG: PAS domain-containing protein [Rhizobiales bacterium]|nr:PAS domain-containing protein [Hyphomicrobiales bacterium]